MVSYADDIKPGITSMDELILVDESSSHFEKASGCRLHRSMDSQKCKILPLGKWRRHLTRESLTDSCKYFAVSEHLDMLGVKLAATWTQTRKANGDIIKEKIAKTVNHWKSGKFMPLSMRPWSINSYLLSKVWFKCGSIKLREGDILAVNSAMKSWLY